MKKQRGQSMVEFALIAPMIFLMIFGMIWGGYMFMEYLRFSNDVRAAARAIALSKDETEIQTNINIYKDSLYDTYKELPDLYRVTKEDIVIGKTEDNKDISITINFTRRNDLPAVLMWVNFPPEKIPPIQYKMRLESTSSSNT